MSFLKEEKYATQDCNHFGTVTHPGAACGRKKKVRNSPTGP
jgi:hypothetical protein